MEIIIEDTELSKEVVKKIKISELKMGKGTRLGKTERWTGTMPNADSFSPSQVKKNVNSGNKRS